MFVPVGRDGGAQAVYQVDKDEQGNVTEKRLFGVMVSLVTRPLSCSLLWDMSQGMEQADGSDFAGSDHRAVRGSQYPGASLRLRGAHLWRRSARALAAV